MTTSSLNGLKCFICKSDIPSQSRERIRDITTGRTYHIICYDANIQMPPPSSPRNTQVIRQLHPIARLFRRCILPRPVPMESELSFPHRFSLEVQLSQKSD